MKINSELLTYISNTGHKIGTEIMRATPDIDYLKIENSGKNLMLSYLSAKRINEVSVYERYNSRLRQSGKIGRILQKILPEVSPDDLRTFVESLQAEIQKNLVSLFVVEGEEVCKVYQIPKHDCVDSELSSSCFQGIVRKDEFEFAINNPDIIKCLVAIKDDKLEGRAIFVHGKIEDKPAILVEGLRGSPRAKILMQRYFEKLKDARCNLVSTADFGKFRATIKPGKVLHHCSLGISSDKTTITWGSYSRGWTANDDGKWYEGSTYGASNKNWQNPDAFKQLAIPKKFIEV